MPPPDTPSNDVWTQLADRAAVGLIRNGQKYRRGAFKRSIKWLILACMLLSVSGTLAYRHWTSVQRITVETLRRIRGEYATLTHDTAKKPWPTKAPDK